MIKRAACSCKAYKFPHRYGGGKCCAQPGGLLCSECGETCDEKEVDFGIGAYEYWGAKSTDSDKQMASDCCQAALTTA